MSDDERAEQKRKDRQRQEEEDRERDENNHPDSSGELFALAALFCAGCLYGFAIGIVISFLLSHTR